jgi:hypothetical protein
MASSARDSIAVVACSFRLSPEDLVGRIRQLFAGRGVRLHGFVVSSKATQERELGQGWTLLPTDNLDFDFSAYFTGVEAVLERQPDVTAVLFLNDTLFTNHAAAPNFRALWRHVGLLQELELPAIVGKADLYATVCLRNPWSGLDRYVTTYCFLLNRQALSLMLKLPFWAQEDGVTHDCRVDAPAWGARLPGAFREFLKANLVYAHSSYLWYRLREGSFSPAQLVSKARCIYFEHRLSGAIADAGCLLPTNAGSRWSTYIGLHERLSRLRRRFGL